jgi:hypothetical protein
MPELASRALYQEVDRRSYDLFQAATEFSEKYKPLTPSQASGLLNVVNCENNLTTIIINFVQHQANKSTMDDPAFWRELRRDLEGLKRQAEEIQQKLESSPETKKAQLTLIHLLLVRDYVQHLVAHNIYRRAF